MPYTARMSWHRIASIQDVAPGESKCFEVQGKELTLVHNESGVWCIDFRCPHTGGPLGSGDFDAEVLTCPVHKWKFRLDDGTHNRRNVDCKPAGVYQLKVEGDALMVRLDEPSRASA